MTSCSNPAVHDVEMNKTKTPNTISEQRKQGPCQECQDQQRMCRTLQELLNKKDLKIQELKNHLQIQEDINKRLTEIIQDTGSKQLSPTVPPLLSSPLPLLPPHLPTLSVDERSWLHIISEVGQSRPFDITTHIPEEKAETENRKDNYYSARHGSKAQEVDTPKCDVITEPEATVVHLQEDAPCRMIMNREALMARQPAPRLTFVNPLRSLRVAQPMKKDHQRSTRPHLLKECPVCFAFFPDNTCASEINRHINSHFSDVN
uniref:uncharacterized protein isoform X2 n=1 Tax=Myxine glutinosa TaxID=7769 RepID=UPI00358E51C3